LSRWLAVVALAISASAPAHADEGFFHRIARELHDQLAASSTTGTPKPIDVRWRATRVGSLTLDAPLVAMAAADLDGDGKAELYAVTTRDVIAIAVASSGRLRELGRVAFAGDPAVPQPRDPIGAAVVDRGVLVASSSSWAHGLRVSWQKGALHADPGDSDFLLCPTEHAQLAPGRNYFGEGAVAYYGVQCADLPDLNGNVQHVRAQLSVSGRLDVAIAGGLRSTYVNVGVAFALGDVDRDGTPEVVFAGAGAPGDTDYVEVVTLGTDEKKPRLKKKFVAAGVAAIAVGDVDGDRAPDAIVAVRLVGGTVVDFWRLD